MRSKIQSARVRSKISNKAPNQLCVSAQNSQLMLPTCEKKGALVHTQNRHSNKANKRWSKPFGTQMHHTLHYTLNALDMPPTELLPKIWGHIRGAISACSSDTRHSTEHARALAYHCIGTLRSIGSVHAAKTVGEHVRKHAQLREALRALHAYLSSPPPLLDAGSVLVSVADGCCGEGSSDKPANIRKKVSGAFGVATRNDAAVASSIL